MVLIGPEAMTTRRAGGLMLSRCLGIPFLALNAGAQLPFGRFDFGAPICDPRPVSSADKVWSVGIEPGTIYGQGETSYTFSRNGAETWSGTLPIYLREAVVTSEGTLAGWGWTGDPTNHFGGALHVVIVAHDGRVLLDEVTPRRIALPTCMEDSGIDPNVFVVLGMHPIEERDQLIVRFSDGEAKRSGEEWRRYRLSSGQPIDRFRPCVRMENGKPIRSSLVQRIVPSTPLVLSQWSRLGNGDGNWGFRWILCDTEANAVWDLDLPTDISDIGENGYETYSEVVKAPNGGILDLGERTFEIRLCAESRRARFEVVRASDGSWDVREIERNALAATAPPADASSQLETEAPKSILPLGLIDLTADDPPRSEAHHVCDFDIDDQSRFVFSRRVGSKSDFDIVRLRSNGTSFDVRRLPAREVQGHWTGDARWIQGDELIAIWNFHPYGHKLCLFSLADGSLRELPESVGYSFHQIERKSDGGFVVLGDDGLMSFDAQCRLLWRRTKSEQLCGGEHFAQDARGRIVVQDFNYSDGSAIQHISCEGRIGAYENLLEAPDDMFAGIRADPRGAWWMTCVAGWVRVDAVGRCAAPLVVHKPDGRPLLPDTVRTLADGSAWASCDGSLFHLTPELEVDRVLGDTTDDLALREVAIVHVDEQGTIHAVSEMTANIFVLDDHGKRLRTIRADPVDFPNGINTADAHLVVNDDGSLIVDNPSGHVRYDAEGKQLGPRSKTPSSVLLRQAGTGRNWSTSNGVSLIDGSGKVVRRVEKSLDGTWLLARGVAATASDGSMATFVAHGDRSRDGSALAVFGREGELKYVLPTGNGQANEIAWNGRHAAFIDEGKLCLLDPATGSRKTIRIATNGFEPSGYSQIFLVREGHEVWLFDGRSRIYRYAVPSFD